MCDCFHLAFPNWHASPGTGAGRRLRGAEHGAEDDSICDEPSQFIEGERPRPQGSSPVEEYPEKYTDSDKEGEVEHDPLHKSGTPKKGKKSGIGSLFDKRSTPKMSKLKEVHSPESEVIVKTAKDGCAEGLVYSGGGKEGLFIKEVVPESPASKNLSVKEGDQILSATVYFDNVTYEDAIQILEHAQAYKVKLCLKRKPDITESEPVLQHEAIPGEEISAPAMREPGKTKRHGDARISWPKFPSFGKGRKSHFTRSHSSSEADEQRKLELSPTTSDTESPIKSQEALKGKKKHKVKLSVLKKRGRVSSSEDQDTEAPTTGPINGVDAHKTQGASSECLDSPSGEMSPPCVEPETVQHKVELINLDSTLKTTDLTAALADQQSPSGMKSPDGKKKKKKEKSELKIRILGKDKSHKKDAKAKSSPKRLQTLGASIEIADTKENEKSSNIPSIVSHTDLEGHQIPLDAGDSSMVISAEPLPTKMQISVPKADLSVEMSDAGLIKKSPKRDKEKTKKETLKLSMDSKNKTDTKKSPTFKLPNLGFAGTATTDTIQKTDINLEECKTNIKQPTTECTEVKEDPYDRLSKSSLSKTQLPKREDIEIPGMEAVSSMKTTIQGIKEPKAVFPGHVAEIQAETVQMSIDVDSVKEAVSKLPGFKLPQVDTAGVPIPEEITVIDANAQRISVKTPTKVLDAKAKQEAHFAKFDIKASPEISGTSVKLPKIKPADSSPHEPIRETKIDDKTIKKEYTAKVTQSDHEIKTELYKREDIIIPGQESTQQAYNLKLQGTEKTKETEGIQFAYESGTITGQDKEITSKTVTLSPKGSDKKSTNTKITMPSFGFAKPDIRFPDIGIGLPKLNVSEQKGDEIKEDSKTVLQGMETELSTNVTAEVPFIDKDIELDGADMKIPREESAVTALRPESPQIVLKTTGTEPDGKGSKFKIPNLGLSMPEIKGPQIDLRLSKKDVDVTLPEAKAEVRLPDVEFKEPGIKVEVKGPQTAVHQKDVEGSPSKFKMPTFKLPKFGVGTSNVTAEVHDMDQEIKIDGADMNIPKEEVDVKAPSTDIEGTIDLKTPETELEGRGSKFKIPNLGLSMPKVKGPKIDLSLSKKDVDETLPETKSEVKLPAVSEIDDSLAKGHVAIPEGKVEVKKLEVEIEAPNAEEKKFKMPKFQVSLPKLKSPATDLSLSKKPVDIAVPEADAEIQLPDIEIKQAGAKVEVTGPDVAVPRKDAEGSASKFKMPTFKMPKFGVGSPHVSVEVPDMERHIKIDGADVKISKDGDTAESKTPSIDIEGGSVDVKTTGGELEGRGNKFKMPNLGLSMPKVRGPQIDLSLSKKDGDITLPEAKGEGKLPDTPEIDVSLQKGHLQEGRLDVKKPEMEIKPPESEMEIEGKESKFKMPKFGISMPKVKGPEIDFSLSKKDVEVTLPEPKAEVQLPDVELKEPSAKVEIKAPQIEGQVSNVEGSPSKFKMPTFKLPKFGFATPNVSVEVPDMDKEIKIEEAELKKPDVAVAIDVTAPHVDIEGPSLNVKTAGTELEGKGSKFKMPHLGISMPKVKGPEKDFSLPKTNVDIALPEAKTEVELPEVEVPSGGVVLEDQPHVELDAKLRKPKFSMPKFSFSKPSVKAPEIGANIPEVDVSLPEGQLEVTEPEVEIKPPESEMEIEGHESKFKMPKFGISMPKVKGPEIDFNLSKKDVEVTLPEAKSEIQFPEVEVKEPSAKVDIKAPQIEAQVSNVKSSPLKFKMPTFNLPKFGPATANVSVEVPDMDKEIKIDGAELKKTEVEINPPSMPKVKGPDIDFSSPKKAVDVTLPEVKAEVQLPEVEVKEPTGGIELEKQPHAELDAKLKMPRFSMPRFSFSKPSVKAPEIDVTIPDVDVSLPEGEVEMKEPEVEIKPPEGEMEIEGKESKFKTPKFGISMPKVKGPEIDFNLSKKDVDITLPEAEVQLPEVEVKEPTGGSELEKPPHAELDAKLKKPRFSMPRFSFSKPSVKAPEIDVTIPDVDVSIPEGEVEMKEPEVEIKPPEGEMEIEGKESKFKMPKFGISMPKVKGPEIDFNLSKKDVDVTLPEAKAEVQLPEVEVKDPSGGVELEKQPHAELDAKLKMPRFSMPRFSFSKASVKAPEIDVNIPDVDVSIPKGEVEVTEPEVEIKPPESEMEIEGQESKFKMPKFGISMPKVKGPEIDFSSPKKDVDITLPEAKAEVQLPEVEVKDPSGGVVLEKQPHAELDAKLKMPRFSMPRFSFSKPSVKAPEIDVNIPDVDVSLPEGEVEMKEPEVEIKPPEGEMEIEGKEGKFKMPKFGISMPKVKGPEIDIGSPKKDVDVTLPEVKAEVQLPEVEVSESSGGVLLEKQPHAELDAKLKMPRFSMPRFSFSKPSVKAPEIDVNIPDVDVSIPEGEVEMKEPEVEIKPPEGEMEIEGKESKFKMPKFGISMPKVKGPEIDFGSPKKAVDVTLPEVKAEVQLPEVEVKDPSGGVELEKQPHAELDAKLKMPRFSMPRFSFSKPSVKAPEIDVNIPDVDVSLPEGEVEVTEPEVKIKPPEGEMEIEGKESKFKMPKFGISMPKAKGPEIDFGSPKKDVDITLPEAKAEVQLPEVEVKEPSGGVVLEKQPHAELDAKLKMPRFSMPRFSFSKPSVKAPEIDVNIPDVDVSLPEGEVEMKEPEVEIKPPEGEMEIEGKESKFKMPKFGISMPKVKGPEIDFGSPKKDVDITLPEAKAEVQFPEAEVKEPSAKVDIKAPQIEAQVSNVKGSPLKFKMPTFNLPKFGPATTNVSMEVPDIDKEIKIDGAELKKTEVGVAVDVTAPHAHIEGPSLNVKTEGAELEGKGGKFKMPHLGISMPKVKGSEKDFSLPKTNIDVTLPEAKAEVQLPEVEVKEPSGGVVLEKQPQAELDAKLKMPRFSMPRFSFSKPSIKAPEIDVNIPDVDVSLPEGQLEVTAPEVKIKPPESEMEIEGQENKFKMPKFGISMPKVKGPEVDFSLQKKDVDITLPEVKADVQLPDVELKDPSAKVEIKAPETKAEASNLEGSPSKFKLPTFKLPKFGSATPNVGVEVPDVDKEMKIDGAELKKTKMGVAAPHADIEGPALDEKTAGTELEGKGTHLKMPRFGISMPKIKVPETDLSSKKDVDVILPEQKTEVKVPDVQVKEPSSAVTVSDAPTLEFDAKLKKQSWSLPKFSFSKADVKAPAADVNLEAPEVEVTIPKAKTEPCPPDAEEPAGATPVEVPPAAEIEAKSRMPRFSLPKFSLSKPSVKGPEVDISLSKTKNTIPEGNVEAEQQEAEIKAPEGEVQLKDTEGSPSKSKTVKFKLSKFRVASPNDVSEDFNMDGSVDTDHPKQETTILDSDAPKTETDSMALGSPSKFKLPSFKMPRLGFSKSKPEDEYVPAETECEESKLEMEVEPQGPGKSPKLTLTSFGEILKKIDVEFDVPAIEEVEEKRSPLKDVHEPDEFSVQTQHVQKKDEIAEVKSKQKFKFPGLSFSWSPEEAETVDTTQKIDTSGVAKQADKKEKDTNLKQDTAKSPEKPGWLKFPKFGLSSPSEPNKISKKDEHENEKSPVGDTMEEDVSTTCSIRSSDAFADISSTVTSEQIGLSLSSPTKVTVKYSDPDATMGLGELHGNVITSTRTELISVEPNLPEKVTIPSSDVSSSSPDTLRLESGKIHVITSNIQATPESQHAKLLTDFKVQSAGGLPLKSEAKEATSWSLEESYKTQGGKTTIVKRHVVRETSSENTETVVITKKMTHVYGVDPAEPISDETATSIQRLRDSVHTEKMKFFDGAKE